MEKKNPKWRSCGALRGGYTIETDHEIIVDHRDEERRYGSIHVEANARLIAAAPEMLEALEMVQEVIDLGNTVGDSVEAFEQWSQAHDVMVQTVSSAIKKARGEE